MDKTGEIAGGVRYYYSDEEIDRWMRVPAAAKIRIIESARLLAELAQSEEQKAIREAFREGKI